MAIVRNPPARQNVIRNNPADGGTILEDPELRERRPRAIGGSIVRNERTPDPLTPRDDHRRKRRVEMLLDHRKHVAIVAKGGKLTAAQQERQDVIEAALGIAPQAFAADVEDAQELIRREAGAAEERAKAPERNKQRFKLAADKKRLETELLAVTRELRVHESLAAAYSKTQNEPDEIKAKNARMFSEPHEYLDGLEIRSRTQLRLGGAGQLNYVPAGR